MFPIDKSLLQTAKSLVYYHATNARVDRDYEFGIEQKNFEITWLVNFCRRWFPPIFLVHVAQRVTWEYTRATYEQIPNFFALGTTIVLENKNEESKNSCCNLSRLITRELTTRSFVGSSSKKSQKSHIRGTRVWETKPDLNARSTRTFESSPHYEVEFPINFFYRKEARSTRTKHVEDKRGPTTVNTALRDELNTSASRKAPSATSRLLLLNADWYWWWCRCYCSTSRIYRTMNTDTRAQACASAMPATIPAVGGCFIPTPSKDTLASDAWLVRAHELLPIHLTTVM